MTRQHFDELVRRIEARYAGRRKALERATAAWVAFGLMGIMGWLTLLFTAGIASFAAGTVADPRIGVWLLGLGGLVIAYALSQAGYILLVESSQPEGRILGPAEATALRGLLDELRGELGCRPFSEIRISPNFNAGVREIPRLGLLGWPRAVLEIGLPLMLALTPDELRAVLAHEFAHLSSRHGQSGNRISRLHRTWGNIAERMQRPVSGSLERVTRTAIAKYLAWFWPRLHARAMLLSRMQEIQADQIAAGLTDPGTMASALWRIECLGQWLSERFWPDIHDAAGISPDPPANVFHRLREALQIRPSQEDAARWTKLVASRVSDHHDTHPALADRISGLGIIEEDWREDAFPNVANPCAADVLLGSDLLPIEEELSTAWQLGVRAVWRERHRQLEAEARRRQSADRESAREPAQQLTSLWESARQVVSLRGPAAAEPLLRAVLQSDPSHIGASVFLGQARLAEGDPEGESLLLQVVAQAHETWMHSACRILEKHYLATGQVERLRELRLTLDRYESDVVAAQQERNIIKPSDRLLPHGLADQQIEPLRDLLSLLPECHVAWLARKELKYFPDRPLFLLCVSGHRSGWWVRDSEEDHALVKRLGSRVELPGQRLVMTRHGSFRRVAAKVIACASSEVYRQRT